MKTYSFMGKQCVIHIPAENKKEAVKKLQAQGEAANMKNVFFITYGGRANNGNSYVPYQAIAHTADEAIAVINTWKSYGRKNSTDPADRIEVNAVTEKKIRNLFRDGFGTYPSGEPRTYMGARTTGCGAWEIGFCPALADTLEEHNRIANELKEMQEQKRKEARKEYEQHRLVELNEQRRGWYHVEIDYTISLYIDCRWRHRTFCGDIIADSGADAYRKAVKYLEGNPPEVRNYYGQLAMFFDVVEMTSSDFSFTFLGVKTDDGYSVELWNEWKAKGEI